MKGISYEQVAAAADVVMAEGQKPTIRAVRDRLGSGSLTTIHKHLEKWHGSIQQPAAAVLTLSQNLTNAIVAEISKNTAEARAGLEEKLHDALTACADLADAGERLELEREEFETQLIELATARDHVAGKAAQLEADLTLTAERAEREKESARNAQVELAMEKLKLIDFQKRDIEQSKETERITAVLEGERTARIAAEQQVAVLGAKQDNALDLAKKADQRIESLSGQILKSSTEITALRDQIQALHAANAAQTREHQDSVLRAERATAEALQQVHRLTLSTEAATKALKQAEREASELRGRLEAFQGRTKQLQTAAG